MNETTRQKKIARLVQKELGEILQIDKRNILGGQFVTVTEVGITPDSSIATAYLSMLLVSEKLKLIDHINGRKSEIRRELGNRIGKQMRIVPDLIFVIDDLQEKADRIDSIIDNLNIPPEPKDDSHNPSES